MYKVLCGVYWWHEVILDEPEGLGPAFAININVLKWEKESP